VSLTSDDKVQFVSSYGGITVATTADDISFTAGQSVAVNVGDHLIASASSISMNGYVTAALTSNGDLTVNGNTLVVNSLGDLDMASANDITGNSQTGTTFSATGDVLINSGSAAQFSSTTDISIKANNYLMNQDDSATLTGSSITGDVSGPFTADSGSDFSVTANKGVTFSAASANFLAQDLLRVKSSNSFSTVAGHTVRIASGDNLIIRGAGTVTLTDATLQIQSAAATSWTATDATVTSTNADISLTNTGDSYVEAGDDLTFNANGDFSLDTRYLSVSGSSATATATTSVSATAAERLRLSGGDTSINAPGGTASWTSSNGYISNSGNVAWKAATVSTTSFGQTTTTRDGISVSTAGSVSQGDVTFTSNEETKFLAREGGSITSAADIALTNGDLYVSANAGLQGEWSLHTTQEITLTGKNSATFSSTADSHEFSSAADTLYRFGSHLEITVSDDGNRNYDTDGDHIDATFTSKGAMSFDVQKFTISSESPDTDDDDGSVYISGDAGVSISSTSADFTVSSRNDDIVFESEDNMKLTTGAVFDIENSVSEVYFNTAEYGTITTGASMTYSADSVLFDSDLLTAITVSESTLVQKANAKVAGDNHVTIAAGTTFALKTDTAAISYTANGGGIQYVSAGTSTLTAGSTLTANVDEDLSFYARSGAFSSAITSTMNFEGGDIVVKTNNNSSMLFDSTGGVAGSSGSDETIELSSGRNFLSLYKENHKISASDDVTIKALGTQADVCITTTVDATGTYDAILFSGAGVSAWTNGTATFTGKSSTVTSIDGSIGLVSYGSQLDPDNLLLPVGIELGVLIRSTANPGTILIESAASTQFYANDRFNSSAEGSISLIAAGTVDIHSNNFLQNVTMMTADGLLTADANFDLKFIAGSPNQAADLVANATGKISFASSSMLVHQYGSNNANKKQGIAILGSLGPVHFSGRNGINVDTSNGDGNINVLARAGDVVISSTSASTTITADRSQVFLEGNTGAFFTATQNNIAFDARTDGGSILVNTQPGTADTSFTAGTNIALTSVGGQFSLDSVSGIIATSATTSITGPCINLVGGGSVEVRSSNSISFTGTNSILADAQVDMTIDAKTSFSVSASGVTNIDAGGDGVQSGFTLSSVGIFKAAATVQDIRLSASVIDFEAQQAYNVLSPQVELTATGSNAGSGDSIVLRAAKGNVIVQSANGITMNSQVQTKLTTSDEVTMTVTGAASNFLVQAGNLAQIVSPAATYTINQDVNVNARDIVMNTEQSWTAISSAGKIVTNAEGTLTTLAPKGISLTTTNGPTTIQTTGLSSDLRFLATGTTSKITMATGGTGAINFFGDGSLVEILPSASLTLTGQVDAYLTAGNLLNVTSHDDLKVTSTAKNLLVNSAKDLLFQDGIRDVADMKFTYGSTYLSSGSNVYMHAATAITFKEDSLLQTAGTSYKAEGINSYTQAATGTLTTNFLALAPAPTGTVLFVARGHQQRLKDSIPIANNPATLTLSSDVNAVTLSTSVGTLQINSDSEIIATMSRDWLVTSAKNLVASATGARGIEISTQNDFKVGSVTRPATFTSVADHMTLDGETGITLATISNAAGTISFIAQTPYESQDPDIIVQSTQSTIALSAGDSINIFPNSVSSYNQERGRGQVSFTTNGANIGLSAPGANAQITNKASNEIRYEANTALTVAAAGALNSIYLEAGGTVGFYTDAQLSFSTLGTSTISLTTSEPFSNIDVSGVYLEMTVLAGGTSGFSFTSTQSNTNRESLIDVHSAENVEFASPAALGTTFTVGSANVLMQSLGHQVVLSGTTLTTSNGGQGALRFSSTGNDGSVDILAGTTLTLTGGKDITMNSRRGNVILENIYSYTGASVAGGQLNFESVNDVIFESLSGTSTWRFIASNNILLESNGPEADVDILNGGAVTYTSTAAANSMNLFSLGNLGSYAAPLRDSERSGTPNVNYFFYGVRVPGNFGAEKGNLRPGYNTRGFEFSAVNGAVQISAGANVFINSWHGSVEFRAQFNIAYAGPSTSTLGFFQQNPHVQIGAIGALFAPADYCLLGGCSCGLPTPCGILYCACSCSGSCPVLTNAIKAIVNVLVGYGLLF